MPRPQLEAAALYVTLFGSKKRGSEAGAFNPNSASVTVRDTLGRTSTNWLKASA